MSKQYGLILPNNQGHQIAPVSAKKPSIFNEDSDSDTTESKPTGLTKTVKKQDKLNQTKAIEEDPTVYQYDEIYDEMDQKRKESKLSRKDLDRKPKYISRLLAAADKRKRENERRIERQVQKEREQEGEEFKDKDSFVTSAYKKKLEEMRELEEQEKREEYLESIGDVRKQGNLDGFYRHLYDQKVNYEDKDKDDEVKTEPKSDSDAEANPSSAEIKSSKPDEVKTEPKSDNDAEANPSSTEIKLSKPVNKRKYRTRKDSDEDKSDEEVEVKKEHLPSNLDADSDFSIDSSDSDDEKAEAPKVMEKPVEVKENVGGSETTSDVKVKDDTIKNEKSEGAEEAVVEPKPKKPKIDIWKKRTVGEKFDEAVKRYFERKALRETGL